MNEVGPDPTYKSTLSYYPVKVENYVIPNTTSKLTLNIAEIHTRNSGKEKISLQLNKLFTH